MIFISMMEMTRVGSCSLNPRTASPFVYPIEGNYPKRDSLSLRLSPSAGMLTNEKSPAFLDRTFALVEITTRNPNTFTSLKEC